MHASRFSSVRHKTHRFDDDESSIRLFKVISIADDFRVFVCCSAAFGAGASISLGVDSDAVDISTSLLLAESDRDDEVAARSRA
jgi:hypothetical protein